MEVNIATYRSRIGSFNTAGHFSYIPDKTSNQSYKSRPRTIYNLRKLVLCMVLLISIISRTETILKTEHQESSPEINSFNLIATATDPVSFFILGGQFSATFFPVLHLSYFDVPGVHSAATVHGVQAGHLDRGWVVIALPLQHSILSDSNFYARYTYGNRANRGIKLSHWNAGNAHLENKTIDIEHVISDHHPHLIGISEANLHRNHCIDNCKIDDYELITCKTLDNVNLQISRVVVYKHTSLVAKVREDLMSDSFSSIWLEVGFPGRARFLVCNIYRDWQYLGQADHSSLEISEQLARWIIFLEQWERALDTGKEVVVMGDFNLDFLSFNRTDLPSPSQVRLKPLVDELFSRIVPHGVKQCVVGPTRQGRVGQADSGLDHLWTNTPGKMSQIYTKYCGSDHKLIMGVRCSKIMKSSTRYVTKRSFKNFDESIFLHQICNTSWWEFYYSTDAN